MARCCADRAAVGKRADRAGVAEAGEGAGDRATVGHGADRAAALLMPLYPADQASVLLSVPMCGVVNAVAFGALIVPALLSVRSCRCC